MTKIEDYSNNTSSISFAILASLVAVGLLKLLLIGNQEIMVEADDALNYVSQADNLGLSFGMRATGYVTWLWAVNFLGVPQRIAIEILWLASVAFLTFSVVPPERRRWLTLPCFAFAAFAPQTYHLFDRTMTEGFYLCLSALMVAFSVRVFRRHGVRKRAGTLVALGLVIGLMAITRNESILLFAFLIIWSVIVGIVDWIYWRYAFTQSCLGALGALAVVCVSAAIIPTALALYNGLSYRVFTPNISMLPSSIKLLKTLAEIETGEPTVRFIPITHKAREMAYAQSPTLARFREAVEDPKNIFQFSSLNALGRPGEIGAGWIWHVYNGAAPSLGITTYSELDATYKKATREIEEGFALGKYRRRFVLHPFLGGDMAAWTPYLGQGFRFAVYAALVPVWPKDDANLKPSEQAIFDRVCMRRLTLDTTSVHIQGWVFSKNNDFPITGVTVEDPPNEHIALSVLSPRPDVQKAFQREGFTPPAGMGFDISWSLRRQNRDITLSFFSGPEIVGRIKRFEAGKVHSIAGLHGDITLGIDGVSISSPRATDSVRERLKTAFLDIESYYTVWAVGLLLSVVCLLTLVFFKRSEIGYLWLATTGILAAWALVQLGFYALLSAAAWEAEPRYMQNTFFFIFFFIVTTVLGTADHLARWLKGRHKPEPPAGASLGILEEDISDKAALK